MTMVWADPSGATWHVTARWVLLDGRLTLVGLDIRGFRGELYAEGGPDWVDGQPTELTQRVLRGIPLTRLRETTRAQGAAASLRNADLTKELAQSYVGTKAEAQSAAFAAVLVEDYTRAAATWTAKGEPRRRLPAATDALLKRVATLYDEAIFGGHTTPAKTVEATLRAEGVPISDRGGRDQVRKWIQRARERGLIPPVNERR